MGCHTLDDQIEFFLSLFSFSFSLLFEDAKSFSFQDILCRRINLWYILDTLSLDGFLKRCLELYPRFC